MSRPKLTLLSLGAGVQSTALLILSARGDLPKLDCALGLDELGGCSPFGCHIDDGGDVA